MPIPGLPPNALGSRVVERGEPWRGSPIPDAPSLLESIIDGAIARSAEEGNGSSRSGIRRHGKLKRFIRGFRKVLDPHASGRSSQSIHDQIIESPCRRKVTPEQWRNYGYWARPPIKGVGSVRNSSPPSTPTLDIDDNFEGLWGPRGSPHPENWNPMPPHPWLPPHPDVFELPDPESPPRSPRELQLNPFLEHRLFGMPSILFDISMPPYAITFSDTSETSGVIPLKQGDLAQPATFPLVTSMVVSAVADDSGSSWHWPIRIYNPKGVKVMDVLDCIYLNFQEYMTHDEYANLKEEKKKHLQKVFSDRCRRVSNQGDQDDGLRRYDYMLGRVVFRGLEPHPRDHRAWVMFVGSY